MPVTKGNKRLLAASRAPHPRRNRPSLQQLVPIVTSSKLAQELNDGFHRDRELCRIAPHEGVRALLFGTL